MPDGEGGADTVHPFSSNKTQILTKTVTYTSAGEKTVTFNEVDEILGIVNFSTTNTSDYIRPSTISIVNNSLKFTVADGGTSGVNIKFNISVLAYTKKNRPFDQNMLNKINRILGTIFSSYNQEVKIDCGGRYITINSASNLIIRRVIANSTVGFAFLTDDSNLNYTLTGATITTSTVTTPGGKTLYWYIMGNRFGGDNNRSITVTINGETFSSNLGERTTTPNSNLLNFADYYFK